MNINQAFSFLRRFLVIFFGKGDQVNLARESVEVVSATLVYRGSQYAAMVLAGSAVTALQKIGWGSYAIVFCLLFIGNTLMTGGAIFLNQRTEVDFTLMEGLRNLISEATKASTGMSCVLYILSFVTLLVWSGADQFIIFFEEKFTSTISKMLTFVLASACSMAIWTYVYIGVASGFWSVVKMLYG